jgi:hypothetical protein
MDQKVKCYNIVMSRRYYWIKVRNEIEKQDVLRLDSVNVLCSRKNKFKKITCLNFLSFCEYTLSFRGI